jgi:hypothetical protein
VNVVANDRNRADVDRGLPGEKRQPFRHPEFTVIEVLAILAAQPSPAHRPLKAVIETEQGDLQKVARLFAGQGTVFS